MTRVKIELFTDMAIYDLIEKAKHGGILIACQRYFKANNPKIAHFSLKTYSYLNNLPPAVENLAVSKDMLCPYTTELVDSLD
ncbi:22090_t:CDS:2, partial [Cetraspora pellucida]